MDQETSVAVNAVTTYLTTNHMQEMLLKLWLINFRVCESSVLFLAFQCSQGS
jgi:hypothetical protein